MLVLWLHTVEGSQTSPSSTADMYGMKGWKGEGSVPPVRVFVLILHRLNVRRDLIPLGIQYHAWDCFLFIQLT